MTGYPINGFYCIKYHYNGAILTSLVMLVSILRSAITFRMPSLIAASLLRPLFNVEVAASPDDVTW